MQGHSKFIVKNMDIKTARGQTSVNKSRTLVNTLLTYSRSWRKQASWVAWSEFTADEAAVPAAAEEMMSPTIPLCRGFAPLPYLFYPNF